MQEGGLKLISAATEVIKMSSTSEEELFFIKKSPVSSKTYNVFTLFLVNSLS